MNIPFCYFNSSPEVIRLAVTMYIRYPLSLRLSLLFIPSDIRSAGRDLFRFRTAPCLRRVRSSVWGAARPTKSSQKTAGRVSMILCLSERVSEGDAEFLGFCRRWNNWEGQAARMKWPYPLARSGPHG